MSSPLMAKPACHAPWCASNDWACPPGRCGEPAPLFSGAMIKPTRLAAFRDLSVPGSLLQRAHAVASLPTVMTACSISVDHGLL
ncbi:hypothetical protein B0G80_5071 [Paraburkholderia sp. BL6669N2]|nr:hypothetical protein B0G80_5071 [Paraburkholderia sp. BL6669N2]